MLVLHGGRGWRSTPPAVIHANMAFVTQPGTGGYGGKDASALRCFGNPPGT
jgi:hypothetical protein